MTKPTKEEQIQAIYDLKVGYTLGHADIAMLKSMARQLLASMEQAHAYLRPFGDDGETFVACDGNDERAITPYAAPQLPQPTVPECYQRLLKHAYGMTMGHDWNKGTMAGHHRENLCNAVEDCRSAMLQGAEPSTDNTNQQFESLSRGYK